MINSDRLVKSFCEMVKIDSPSGEEDDMAVYLDNKLTSLGFQTVRDDYGNLIANNGTGENDPILLSAHMDTVEPGRGINPTIDEDRIISDGTTILGGDCKAGIAAIIEGIESATEDAEKIRPLEIAFTKEEEIGLVGARNLDFSLITSRLAIVFDGEGPVNRITSSSPTYIGFSIEITGKSAHAGVEPEKGISAIKIAADLITKLPQGRIDENTTANIGTIEGGSGRNTVPETASIIGEFRSTNLENLDSLRMQIAAVVTEVGDMHPDATLQHHMHTEFETYTLTDDDPATLLAKKKMNSIGLDPVMKPSGGGTDGNVFRLNEISSVVVGMADNGMHTVRESVNIPDLVDAAHFCESIIRAEEKGERIDGSKFSIWKNRPGC